MITTQKVVAILRKAGCQFSKYEASGMVRGWGSSSEGYEVRKWGEGRIRIDYRHGSYARNTSEEVTKQRLVKVAEILSAVGLDVRNEGLWLYVAAAPPATPGEETR
jgi:hypothetical protein